jgi:hypothetical protein
MVIFVFTPLSPSPHWFVIWMVNKCSFKCSMCPIIKYISLIWLLDFSFCLLEVPSNHLQFEDSNQSSINLWICDVEEHLHNFLLARWSIFPSFVILGILNLHIQCIVKHNLAHYGPTTYGFIKKCTRGTTSSKDCGFFGTKIKLSLFKTFSWIFCLTLNCVGIGSIPH